MHWTAHKAIWYPGFTRVCGRKIRPFTLGHLRLLEIIESPLRMSGAIGIIAADVAQAVAILGSPLPVARWLVGHRWAMRCWASWCVRRPFDWRVEAPWLVKHINDCLWTPEMFQKDGEESSVFGYSSSFSMRIAWKLANGEVPTIKHRVWRLSIIEAMAWAVTSAEMSGRGFVTRDEMEKVEAMAAAQAKREAEQGAANVG